MREQIIAFLRKRVCQFASELRGQYAYTIVMRPPNPQTGRDLGNSPQSQLHLLLFYQISLAHGVAHVQEFAVGYRSTGVHAGSRNDCNFARPQHSSLTAAEAQFKFSFQYGHYLLVGMIVCGQVRTGFHPPVYERHVLAMDHLAKIAGIQFPLAQRSPDCICPFPSPQVTE